MQLIKITEQHGKQVVSARELYEALGFNKAHWAKWAKKNITSNSFAIEGQDYTGFTLSVNGNETQDFAITLDFAKRLSMLARTDKGEQVRNYFLSCEKKLLAPKSEAEKLLEAFTILHKQVEQSKEQLILAENTIMLQAPKVEYHDKVMTSDSLITTTIIAKELGMTAARLNDELRTRKIQFKVQDTWVLASKYQNQGYTRTQTYPYKDTNGETKSRITTYWTEKGRQFIHRLFNPALNN